MPGPSASFPLQVVIQGIDRLTAPLKATQEKVAKALKPLKEVNNSFQRLREAAGLDRVASAVGELGGKLSSVKDEAVAAATKVAALVTAAGAGATAIVVGFSHAGVELVRLSSKLNVGIGTLQEWRHAARLAHVEDEQLERGLNLLAKNVGLAAAGTGPARGAFRRLGVDVKDANGRVRTLDSLLPEIADKLNGLTDPGRRTALVTQIFGRGGADLIPLLREGSDGLRDAGDEARRLGIVMSDEAAKKAEAFEKAWVKLQEVLLSVRNTVGEVLLPVVGELVDELRDWLVAHRGDIAAWAREIAHELPGVLRQVRDAVREVGEKLEPVIRLVGALVQRFGVVRVAAVAFGVVLTAKLGLALLEVVPALANLAAVLSTTLLPALVTAAGGFSGMAAAAWAALAPIAAVAAAVGSIAYLAVVVHDNWAALASFFQDMWDDVKFGTIDFVRWLDNHVPFLLGPVTLIVRHWSQLRRFFSELWSGIRDTIGEAVDWIASKVRGLTDAVPDWLVDLFRAAPAPVEGPGFRAQPAALGATPGARAGAGGQAAVRVSFDNLPRGARVQPEQQKDVDLDLEMGYAFAGAP